MRRVLRLIFYVHINMNIVLTNENIRTILSVPTVLVELTHLIQKGGGDNFDGNRFEKQSADLFPNQ